jgi:hypothetical protein
MYRLLAVLFLSIPLFLSHTSQVAASAPTQVTFLQTVTSDDFLSSRSADGNTFFVDVAQGELVGLGTFTETDYFLLHADGTGVFHGVDTCICTIDGRSGTLTIRYTGTMAADGSFVSPFVIVHGTGDLAGMHGTGLTTGTFTGALPVDYTNVLTYHFTS